MSRHLDSSTNAQMAKIMVQYGRPSLSSWAKSARSSSGRTIMGKAIWENPIAARLGEGFQMGILIRTPWKKGSSYLCMWMTYIWLERNKTLFRCGKYSVKKSIWENQHLSLIRIPGMYWKTMWNKQRYCWQLQNHVWIANFRRSNWKTTMLGKSEYLFMVLWHGRSCQEMCGAILRAGEQNNPATVQSIYSMHRLPPLQRRRNEICWSIVKIMLSICPEMPAFGTHW